MTSDHSPTDDTRTERSSIDELRTALTAKDERIADLEAETDALRERLSKLETAIEESETSTEPTHGQVKSSSQSFVRGDGTDGESMTRRGLLASLGGLGLVSVTSNVYKRPYGGTKKRLGNGQNSDPVAIGDGASAADTATVVGPNSVAPSNSVIIGEGIDASGNDGSTIVGQSNASNGKKEVTIGYDNDGDGGAVTAGTGISNYKRSVTLGHNAKGANRNSVAIGANVNENAPSLNGKWPGIRVAIGSRAAANERGTAVGPGAGEYGTPGKNVVNIGNEASASGDYSIAIGDQREIGTKGNEEAMIKPDAVGSVAIGTSVEIKTPRVARIGTSTTSNPGPRQLVWQGVEQLANADYVKREVTLLMDEKNSQFVIKGKDSNGNIRKAKVPWTN